MQFFKYLMLGATVFAATGAIAQAAPTTAALPQAFEKARRVDPLYLAGLSEYDGTILEARAAGMAYFPQLQLSSSQLPNEAGGRRNSISLIQPLLSADKLASLREKDPRSRLGQAQLIQREMDLAKRLFAAYSELVVTRETLRQNKARLTALEQQVSASKRLLALNQGTVPDVRDAEVKLLQARSEELRMRGQLQIAERQYVSIVGESSSEKTLSFGGARTASLSSLAADVRARSSNPAQLVDGAPDVVVAQTNRELADIDAFRARSAWMPEINVVHTRTRLDGTSNTFTGVSLSLPLSAGNFVGMQSAGAKAAKSAQEAQDTYRQTLLEIERLRSAIEFGSSEVAMQQSAVEAAELSVEANEKSFKGGVRSMQDVLASIELLHTVKADRVKSLLTLAESLLNLRMIEGVKAVDSLAEVESFLLR
jgi:outer membrane protein TolC